ncbi:hypothetical protein DID88_007935 [Monilinia fructigena]|uniref:BZIP domain-containing protein n=1 Tax=Monilinia fructigena TaxID=38457 RepID=A0A395J3U1_9HELO|nr:hypothetical protein DID88_007935 [Monilinia fructigena]
MVMLRIMRSEVIPPMMMTKKKVAVKRREGDDKSSKKPGRKPITSEPTSKRKAQNRAAQRAFRERKEKHLKDLETKVEDLEKASESANHENSILRAQIERMSLELREYKKRLSINGGMNRSPNGNLPAYFAGKGLPNVSANPNDINFQFEFPRFGRLPGPPVTNGSSTIGPSISPTTQNAQTQIGGDDMSSFSGLFAPEMMDNASKSAFEQFGNGATNGSMSSTDLLTSQPAVKILHIAHHQLPHTPTMELAHHVALLLQNLPTCNHHTTRLLIVTLTTIGEENACSNVNSAPGNNETAAFDVNGIDWFAQQNNNQFDPQLFGDYREPQNNILSNDAFTLDGFFADAFDVPDFNSPFNVSKSNDCQEGSRATIDEKQNEDDEVVPAEDRSTMLSCNTIWDRLQKCPKVKEGDFDLDNLCKDLQRKPSVRRMARCQ